MEVSFHIVHVALRNQWLPPQKWVDILLFTKLMMLFLLFFFCFSIFSLKLFIDRRSYGNVSSIKSLNSLFYIIVKKGYILKVVLSLADKTYTILSA